MVGPPDAAAALAARALLLAPADPSQAARVAGEALMLARATGDGRAAAEAERALGLAARATHDIDGAVVHLRRSVRLAGRAGHVHLAARARVTLAGTLALRGQWAGALAEIDRAHPFLTGIDLAVLDAQRSFVLGRQGRLAEAATGFEKVLPAFRRAGDTLMEARCLTNLAMCHAHNGNLGAAEASLVAAEALHVDAGHLREAADARQNLGWVTARRGDIPAALAWFERADEYFRSLDIVDAVGLQDRCEALLSARLVDEARAAAERAVAELEARGMAPRLAEARLLLAEAALLQGDLGRAKEEAERARRAFARQGRPGFVALARHTALRVAWAAEPPTPSLLSSARRTVRLLDAAGWAAPALDARLIAAQLAIGLGRTRVAAEELVHARRARHTGPVELRSRAWHAEALRRLAAGDRSGAGTALRAGLRIVEVHRAALGATELRASASAHGAELARLGLRLAIEAGSPAQAFSWAERWRAGALALRPVRPPDDVELAADLVELKRVMSDADRAAREGRPVARLLARQATVERAIRDRARRLPGLSRYSAPQPPASGALREALGDRVLVELADAGSRLHAIVVAGPRYQLLGLGPVSEVRAELESVRHSIRRLAFGRGTPASLAAAAAGLAYGAKRLDQLLLAPLSRQLGSRPLVIVPTGAVHGVPWSILPSCAGRAVTVAPSAALWWRAAQADIGEAGRAHGAGVCLVVGPGLPQAAAEVDELARRYPAACHLAGPDATVAAVLARLDGVGLAHVAAHGRFRADNPLFSCIELADGPLTVYDIESLHRAPRLLVLSACDSGVSGVQAGDELLGLAAALFSLGTRTLIASLLPVSDVATKALMLGLHDGLDDGLRPAAALARAQAAAVAGGVHEDRAAAAAFVCLGAG